MINHSVQTQKLRMLNLHTLF